MNGKLQCRDCRHEGNSWALKPCSECIHGGCQTLLNHYENKYEIKGEEMTAPNMVTKCTYCGYKEKPYNVYPCSDCKEGLGKNNHFIDSDPTYFSTVQITEANNCENCFYEDLPLEHEICETCCDCDNWKPKKTSPDYMEDPVNSPTHYTAGGIETFDFLKAKLTTEQLIGYCMGNVLKYVSRFNYKNGLEDLEKALWYLNKAVELMKGAN